MFIPATEIAAGISTGFGSRLAEGLSDRLSIDRDPIVTANQDFLLFLELLGVRDCTDELDGHLRFIVERTLRQADLSCPDLYDATHGIFYLTRFGRLPGRCERLSSRFTTGSAPRRYGKPMKATSTWRQRSWRACSLQDLRWIAGSARSPGELPRARSPMAELSARAGNLPPSAKASGAATTRHWSP